MAVKTQDRRWRFATVLSIGVVFVISFFALDRWPEELRSGDPWGYYAHLPALFIHGDVGDYRKTIEATQHIWPGQPNNMLPTEIGRQSDKYPLGVATLLVPFFLIAHAYALFSGQPAEGFSHPYTLICGLGVIFYVLCGLYVLFGVLRRYFSLSVTVLLIVALSLATNLFYFTTYNNMMAHALLFSLYCFLLSAIHWFEDNPTALRRAALVGLCVGLITLTRLHEAIVVLLPLLWGVYSWSTLRLRQRFLVEHWKSLLVAALVAAVVVFPQFAYYKFTTGHWLHYAYTEESFYFRHPHIWNGLTHFSNGWLVYTPLMIFALLGIFALRRFAPSALVPILSFLPLHLYITYSWWCWYYINGLGSRPMVETYPLLALPLGAFFSWYETKRWKQLLQVGLVAFFAWLCIFQTIQVRYGILWSENANAPYFWEIFGTLHPNRNSLIEYESDEPQPNHPLVLVNTLGTDPMEDSTAEHREENFRHGGRYSIRVDNEFAGAVVVEPAQEVRPGDWIRVSVWAFKRIQQWDKPREKMASLVLEMRDAKGKEIKYRAIRITSKVANPNNSIWSTGEPGEWGEASYFVRVPRHFPPDGRIKAYVWNPGQQELFVDDLSMELWRRK